MNQSVAQVADQPSWHKLLRRHHDLLRASDIGGLLSTDKVEPERPVEMILDEISREIWLGCLWRALEESDFADALREEFWNWMEPLSIQMVSGRTQKSQLKRYSFHWYLVRARHPALGMCRR